MAYFNIVKKLLKPLPYCKINLSTYKGMIYKSIADELDILKENFDFFEKELSFNTCSEQKKENLITILGINGDFIMPFFDIFSKPGDYSLVNIKQKLKENGIKGTITVDNKNKIITYQSDIILTSKQKQIISNAFMKHYEICII